MDFYLHIITFYKKNVPFITLTRPKKQFSTLFHILKDLFSLLDADQQRREKLKKELARCEKEFKLTKTAMRANSKNNSKSLFNTLQKVR